MPNLQEFCSVVLPKYIATADLILMGSRMRVNGLSMISSWYMQFNLVIGNLAT